MMDHILIDGIKVFAFHGLLPEEKERGQQFSIDVDIAMEGEIGRQDEISTTIDYSEVVDIVVSLATEERHDLIETLASNVAERILSMAGARQVTVTVRKPEAPLDAPVDWVGVSVCRNRPREGG